MTSHITHWIGGGFWSGVSERWGEVPVSHYPFIGWKASLFGDTHAHGVERVHFSTRGKVVTSRWLDPSHGGINLGFPTQSQGQV